MKAEEYLRLKPEELLSDSVIEAFPKSIAMKNTILTNHIFVILSRLLWGHVERNEPYSLKRVFRGLPLYSMDFILASFHASEFHWLLCVINVHERIITTIDSYISESDEPHLASETILACVRHMFEKPDSDYGIC